MRHMRTQYPVEGWFWIGGRRIGGRGKTNQLVTQHDPENRPYSVPVNAVFVRRNRDSFRPCRAKPGVHVLVAEIVYLVLTQSLDLGQQLRCKVGSPLLRLQFIGDLVAQVVEPRRALALGRRGKPEENPLHVFADLLCQH